MNYTEVFCKVHPDFLFLYGVLTDSLVSFFWFLLNHHRPFPPMNLSLFFFLQFIFNNCSSFWWCSFSFPRRISRRLRWTRTSHCGLNLSSLLIFARCFWSFICSGFFPTFCHQTVNSFICIRRLSPLSSSCILCVCVCVCFSIVFIAFIFSYWLFFSSYLNAQFFFFLFNRISIWILISFLLASMKTYVVCSNVSLRTLSTLFMFTEHH